jgi:hypothetical protein
MKIVYDNISKGKFLGFSTFLKASLHHAASVLVRANLNAIIDASIEYELSESLILLTTFAIRFLRIL